MGPRSEQRCPRHRLNDSRQRKILPSASKAWATSSGITFYRMTLKTPGVAGLLTAMIRLWSFRMSAAVLTSAVLSVGSVDALAGQASRKYELLLDYGIRLEVPGNWRADNAMVSAAMRSGRPTVDASSLRPDEGGHLITFATPSSDTDAASLSMTILPTGVSQADMARMSDQEVRAGEENSFRPEAERAARKNRLQITAWDGTSRQIVGGRYGLLTSYRFKYPNGQEMVKQTFSVYLGKHALHLHVFRPAAADQSVVSALNLMIQSLDIPIDSL
jgi:hypothetical protein